MDEKINKAAESIDAGKTVISPDTGKTDKSVSKKTVGNKPATAKTAAAKTGTVKTEAARTAVTQNSKTANNGNKKSKTSANIKNTKSAGAKTPVKKAEDLIIPVREDATAVRADNASLPLYDNLKSLPVTGAVITEEESNVQNFETSSGNRAIAEDEKAENIINRSGRGFGADKVEVFDKKQDGKNQNDKKAADNVEKSIVDKDGEDIEVTQNKLDEAAITEDNISCAKNGERKVTLKLTDLTKKFGERTSVDKVNLEVYEGEVFGFLGPNGAGKTTTIRMITGLASISSGEVLICGKSMKTDFRAALNNIGGIIENPEMYKYMSGWDNLKYYASLYSGISDEKIMEVVKLVRMENRIHEKVKRYSLGMRQRVGIAQSLLHSPKLLLLDEPTNGLDPKGIHEMRDFLKMLAHERGLSVFISSHILSEMQLMCDRVAIISQGKCIAIKSVDEWTQEGTTKKVKLSVPNAVRAAELIREKFNIEVQTNGSLLMFTIDDSKIADISILLAAGKIPVLSLIVGEKSLEETFLELTSQDNMIIT